MRRDCGLATSLMQTRRISSAVTGRDITARESLNLVAPRNSRGHANVIHPPPTVSMPANPLFCDMKYQCGFAMRVIGAATAMSMSAPPHKAVNMITATITNSEGWIVVTSNTPGMSNRYEIRVNL